MVIESKTYNILLIDDDEDEFVLLKDIVGESTALGKFEWVADYDAAEKYILQGAYDCYLVDYYMGARTGVELLRQVREKGSRAPIIILTGQDGDDIDIEALDAGATDYLEKGLLTTSMLERAVRYAVHQQTNQSHLEDLVQQVTHLEKLKTDMIRIAAHDLRNPLTTINGYLEMLRNDFNQNLDDAQKNYLRQIKEAVERMQKMVGDILSLERIAESSGGYTDQVNFSELVSASFKEYNTDTHDMQCLLPDEPVMVYGMGPLLREAVDNLLSNAVKYTPDGGTIKIHLTTDADSALLEVQDTGYGIPRRAQDGLFTPFYRAKAKETRHIQGTGLGLHLVKNIVERHNGHIYFDSEQGKGSTFGFMLPQIDEG